MIPPYLFYGSPKISVYVLFLLLRIDSIQPFYIEPNKMLQFANYAFSWYASFTYSLEVLLEPLCHLKCTTEATVYANT